MDELIISDRPLKEFLTLFNRDEELNIIELGDTWYPAAGFADETNFPVIKTVNDLLIIDYDFKGLVIFIARVGTLSIEYHGGYYKISGNKKKIKKLKYRDLYRL
jgi:hypothetical protein